MSKFLSTLKVEQIEDISESGRGTWRLLAPLIYESDITGGLLIVPTGFVTDFMTVPRIPIIFDLLGDRGNAAGALHDWMYSAPHPVDRETADRILKEAYLSDFQKLELSEASKLSAQIEIDLIYEGVRVGGESHWE